MKQTKEMLPPEAQRLCVVAYSRIIKNGGKSILFRSFNIKHYRF